MGNEKKRNPWSWIPTLYFAQGLPYVAVNIITVIMFKRMGISNTDITLYTGWLYLPWVIKPFWSPFIDIIKTKRWWTVLMQWIIGIGFAGIAFALPTSFFFQLTLAIFWLIGFTSATHDIASDGYYMIALNQHDQAAYVGIRSTFYRVATIVGQGILVIIAGVIESNTGLEPSTITIEASPNIASATTVQYDNILPSFQALSADQKSSDQFIYTADKITAGTIAPDSVTIIYNDSIRKIDFKAYSSIASNLIKEHNEKYGFVDVETDTQNKAASEKNGFEKWIKSTFGEEERKVKNITDNFCIVGVRLTQQPPADEERVLIVNLKSGDKSISIGENRFVFNSSNWDKTAYLMFMIDNKLSSTAVAEFECTSGNIAMAWMIVFFVLSAFFLAVAAYHSWILPHPAGDKSITSGEKTNAKDIVKGFIETFKTFFQKKQIWVAMAFMLLYRLPEAQLIKIINPFFLDPVDQGGLGLTTGQVGLVYGTIGIIALTLGGIIGGLCAAKGGLKKWLWPMALSISLNSIVYIILSAVQPDPSTAGGLTSICIGMFVDQFGYGFGFTAFMLYMMYFSDGPYKTSHYAICTAFMALGMMLPGMWSGWLQDLIGYNHFFIWTLICCVATWIVTALIKVDPNYGKKHKEPKY